jgi:hypothetical protein
MPKTIAEIKAMESAVAEARGATKAQLLDSGKQIVNQLFELGFDFELVEKNGAGKPERICSKCNQPGHTARTCGAK